jgi:hypothetical protein
MQNCRFHCAYYPDGVEHSLSDNNPVEDEAMNLHSKSEVAEFEFLEDVSYETLDAFTDDYDHRRYPSVELRKAWDIFHKRFSGMTSVCDDCFEMIDKLSLGCGCEMFNHFVGQR